MKTLKTIFILLACSFASMAQDPVQGKDYKPWENSGYTYCAVDRHWPNRLQFPQVYTDTPLPGKSVSVYTFMRAGTDWHTHEIGDLIPRPTGTFLTPIIASTVMNAAGTEACVNFIYRNAGFSGITETTMATTDGSGPTVKWFNPLKVSDKIQNQEFPLKRLIPNSYTGPLTTPLDLRHRDYAGIAGYSFYGTELSVHMIKVLMFAFAIAPENTLHFVPRILRGSLPNGGYADNEVGFQQNTPMLPAWGVRIPAETHQYGVEWDIENPSLWLEAAGKSNQEQLDIWLLFKAVVIGSGCSFGKLNPSTGYPMTDKRDSTNQWLTRSVVHLNCISPLTN